MQSPKKKPLFAFFGQSYKLLGGVYKFYHSVFVGTDEKKPRNCIFMHFFFGKTFKNDRIFFFALFILRQSDTPEGILLKNPRS